MRGLCSAMLVLEAIVLALATPVMIAVENISKPTAMGVGFGLAAVCLLVTVELRRRWGYILGFAVQAATIATGFFVSIMFVIGPIFAMLWYAAWRLGRRIEADKAAGGQ